MCRENVTPIPGLRSCLNCRHWRGTIDTDCLAELKAGGWTVTPVVGICRRRVERNLPVFALDDVDEAVSAMLCWQTGALYSCGHFERRGDV